MTLGTFAVILTMKRNGLHVEEISGICRIVAHQSDTGLFLRDAAVFARRYTAARWLFREMYVFVAAIKAGLFTLAVVGVSPAWSAAYYYLSIIKVMYFANRSSNLDPMRLELRTVLAVAVSSYLLLRHPAPLVSVATVAAKSLF